MYFSEIYEQHKDMVYNLALQYVQNREDAQEITQDTFVSVYNSLKDFNHNSKVSTWIYRIAINKSLDFIKARQRKKKSWLVNSLFLFGSNNESFDVITFDHPGVLLEQKESMEAIFRCINRLPENQKTAIILSKIEQHSLSQIAEIMNLSIKAVESLLQRAKANLQKYLDETEGKD